jgi:hypothetical protein
MVTVLSSFRLTRVLWRLGSLGPPGTTHILWRLYTGAAVCPRRRDGKRSVQYHDNLGGASPDFTQNPIRPGLREVEPSCERERLGNRVT